jgi:excisionase family DNA binding protein
MARTIAGALDVRRLAYSLQEAAAALSVGVTKLQRAISHDLIRSTKIGASIRIPADEVERIARDGLPDIPAGYKRKTNGNTHRGRRAKTKRRG